MAGNGKEILALLELVCDSSGMSETTEVPQEVKEVGVGDPQPKSEEPVVESTVAKPTEHTPTDPDIEQNSSVAGGEPNLGGGETAASQLQEQVRQLRDLASEVASHQDVHREEFRESERSQWIEARKTVIAENPEADDLTLAQNFLERIVSSMKRRSSEQGGDDVDDSIDRVDQEKINKIEKLAAVLADEVGTLFIDYIADTFRSSDMNKIIDNFFRAVDDYYGGGKARSTEVGDGEKLSTSTIESHWRTKRSNFVNFLQLVNVYRDQDQTMKLTDYPDTLMKEDAAVEVSDEDLKTALNIIVAAYKDANNSAEITSLVAKATSKSVRPNETKLSLVDTREVFQLLENWMNKMNDNKSPWTAT